MRAKIFVVNGTPRIKPTAISPPTTTLPGMVIGAHGDPHLYLRVSSIDNTNQLVSRNVAKWGDNKDGPSGNNELLLIDLETLTDSIKVFYTNKSWINGAKIVDNVRIVYNGVSTIYTNTTRLIRGPIVINIVSLDANITTKFLNFEVSWNTINNLTKLGGAIVPILKRAAANNGKEWNGGDGAKWDGFGRALAPYGLTRSSFETGFGIQSLPEELQLLTNESNFLQTMIDNAFVQNNNILDGLENLGEDGEGDRAAVRDWDDTIAQVEAVLTTENGLEGYVSTNINLLTISNHNLITINQENLLYI